MEYGQRRELPENVIEECIELTIYRFQDLGLKEVREAFRAAASGELDVTLELYGNFNAATLGRVLQSYRLSRRDIIHEIYQKMEERNRAIEATKESKRKAFDTGFQQHIRDRRDKINSWRDIPAYWYDAATRLGLLSLTPEEKREIWEQAKSYLPAELRKRKSANRGCWNSSSK